MILLPKFYIKKKIIPIGRFNVYFLGISNLVDSTNTEIKNGSEAYSY